MLNWCSNTLIVVGNTQEALEKFIAAVKGNNTELSLDSLVPCPRELKEMTKHSIYSLNLRKNAAHVRKVLKARDPKISESEIKERIQRENELVKQYNYNIAHYGFASWYEFCAAMWGVAWDVKAKMERVEDKTAVYSFESMEVSPKKWLIAVAKMFPNCNFLLHYNEPNNGFMHVCGDAVYEKEWVKC